MPLPSDPKRHNISEVARRDIVDALLLDGEPFHGRLDLISFLKRIWPLGTMPSEDHRFKDAEGDIWQHMVNNSDWTDSELLYRRLSITDISDERFARFVETCVHPLASPSIDRVNKLVGIFNDVLQHDGFALRASGGVAGRPVYKVLTTSGTGGVGHEYEVVFSFAGEDRDYVQRVADILRMNQVSLFYDTYEEVTLWGKNLTEHLHTVYSGSARFCVMFISQQYAEKVWPSHERRSAFEKAIQTKGEYILPARFDDTEIPGLYKTIGFIDLRKKSPAQFASLILQKLGRPQFDVHSETGDTDEPPF